MEKIRKSAVSGVSGIILLLIIMVNIIPFVYMFAMSFKSTINAYDMSFAWEDLTLMQYQKVFALDGFERYIFNSVFVSVMGVLLTLAVCSLAGYAFAKLDFKGREKMFFLMVLTILIPSEVIIVPLFLVTKSLNLLNTYWALILPLPTAFGVFIMRQAMLQIPSDLIGAAKIDGSSNIGILWHVILPLIKSSLLAVAIFSFVGSWNNFIWPLVVSTKTEMKTLPLALSTMKTQYNSDVGLTMACAVINFLPPFIFYMVTQSRFKEGLAMNGLKG